MKKGLSLVVMIVIIVILIVLSVAIMTNLDDLGIANIDETKIKK